jgi:hypothetical protein
MIPRRNQSSITLPRHRLRRVAMNFRTGSWRAARCSSWVTRDGQRAAEHLDAVAQTGDSGSFGSVGSADSVVSNRQVQVLALGIDANFRHRRLCVFGRVREGLGDAC